MSTTDRVASAVLVLVLGTATLAGAESFFLRAEAAGGKMYGPYVYADGTTVGSGQNTYKIVQSDATQFSLLSTRTDVLFGPFTYQDGARIVLGRGTLILMQQRAFLRGKLQFPRLRGRQVTVRVAPVSPGLLKGFYEIRASFGTLEQRHRVKTAPIRAGPIVVGPTGHRRSGYIERSERDIEKSRQSVDRQAQPILSKFAQAVSQSTVNVQNGGSYAIRDLSRGQYLVIAEGTMQPDDGSGRLSAPVYWWGTVNLGESEPVDFNLDGKSALSWSDLYGLILANDPALGIAPK
jgi:hypothetical protein